jgi:CheY-like chemotaxis protein
MAGKILIVDDEPGFRELLEALLGRHGLHVAGVRNGALALAKIGVERFDLIVLDILMPEIDGLEVCRRLRLLPQTKDTPILMFSVRTDPDVVVQSFEAGASDYLPKPSMTELPDRVLRLLAQHRSLPMH